MRRMARKESVGSTGSFDDQFHEDPIPGLITGMDDNCYEVNLVTRGGRTVESVDREYQSDFSHRLPLPDDDDDGGGVVHETNFAEMLDMSSLWEELEGLGVRTSDIDEFMLRFGSSGSSSSPSKDAYWDSGVESDFFGGPGLDEAGSSERKVLYEQLKRGGLFNTLGASKRTTREEKLKAFIEEKVERIRKWRAALKSGLLRVRTCFFFFS